MGPWKARASSGEEHEAAARSMRQSSVRVLTRWVVRESRRERMEC
jgi:hypothetical protein